MAYDGTIKIDSAINTKGFSSGIKSMTASLKGLAAAVGLAFGVGAVVLFGKSAVSAASELAAAMTGLKSVLDGTGKSFADGQRFINDYIKDGLVPATNAINAYKNLAIRGYDTSQIEQTLIALKDSASFARQNSLTMGQAIQGASEGLKNENSLLVDNSGVTKNVSVMWKEYADQIGTTVGALTKQQKIQAEVNGILEETRFQTGDAAKLSGQYSGLVAALGTSFYNLKVAVGNTIIPILTAIIPVVKSVVDWLVILFNQFAQVMNALFGMKMGLDNVADSTKDAADASKKQADATDKAKKAALGALAAFDEINVLQQKDETAPGETPTTPAAPGAGTTPGDGALGGLQAKIAEFMAGLGKLLQPAMDAFGRLKDALTPLGETIWEGLKWAWDNILKPLGEWAITDLLPAFLDLLSAGLTALNSVIEALKPLGLWLWEEFLKPVGKWAGKAVIDGLGWLTDKLYEFSDWAKTHQKTIQNIATIIGIFAAVWLAVNVAMSIFAVVGAAAAVVMAVLTSPITLVVLAIAALIGIIYLLYTHWDEIKAKAIEVWEQIKRGWERAADWFNETVLIPLADWFSGAWEDIKGFFGDAWSWIKNAWIDAKTWFNDKVIIPISDFFKNAWEDIKSFPGNAWTSIKEAWRDAKTWFSDNVIDPLKEKFSAGLDVIKNAFETVFGGVKDFIRARINDIITFINTMISALASGINTIINALNSINVTIPSWVPVVGGNSWGISIPTVQAPQIPYLATGAVIPPNAAFAAVLGDQKSGRNLEAPEALIRQIVREESQRQGAQAITVRFEGRMAPIVRLMNPVIEQERTRVGGSLIAAGARS